MSKIRRESIRDQVRRYIVEAILDGTFPPGYRLRETELAQEFGTSQSPVREALRELEGLRYVQTSPFRGTRVREVSTAEMSEAYLVQGMLEQTAAELACTESENDWTHLRTIAVGSLDAAKGDDIEAYSAKDWEFHRFIIESSGISLIQRLWDLLFFETRARLNLETDGLPLTDLGREHLAILAALEKGDGKKAGELLRSHAKEMMLFLGAEGTSRSEGLWAAIPGSCKGPDAA